jgi:hypothetical protein
VLNLAVKHYVDDIPPSTGRVYQIETDGNTSKITDVTEYQQVGTSFSANDVNCTCVLECNYSKSGTVHELTTENIESENIKFFTTADFNKGDTFTFNGTPVAAQTTDGLLLGASFFKANAIVSCLKKGNTLYFASSNRSVADDVNDKAYYFGIENGTIYIEEG